jgi:pimeloyl-ACP methyl ester carboxylesterase
MLATRQQVRIGSNKPPRLNELDRCNGSLQADRPGPIQPQPFNLLDGRANFLCIIHTLESSHDQHGQSTPAPRCIYRTARGKRLTPAKVVPEREDMLARLQQLITTFLLTTALAWLALTWHKSPVLAMSGFMLIVFGYSLVLALEFLLLRHVNRADPAPLPSSMDLARAWIGETLAAPRIFCWRQPFRSNAVPDQLNVAHSVHSRRGVVLVHGFFCNRGFWTPWMLALEKAGHAFIAVNLEPVFGSVDDYAHIIEQAVNRITVATGMAPVIVGHSMGGLAVRAWLRAQGGHSRVHHVITIGTPHGGTWLGRFGYSTNGSQMRLDSQWVRDLTAHELTAAAVPFTCWYSNCDNIVFPTSTATLAGADNRLVHGVAHVRMAFHSAVMAGTLEIVGDM